MRFWIREVLGWVLIILGLIAFARVYYVFLADKRTIEAIIFGLIGFTVFRGGMHLLKVATAARAAMDIRKELAAPKPLKVLKLPGNDRTPGRQRPSVVPGERRAK